MKVKTFALAIGAASGLLLAGTATADVDLVVTQLGADDFAEGDFDSTGLHVYRFAVDMAPGMRIDGVRGIESAPASFFAGTMDDPQPFFNSGFESSNGPGNPAFFNVAPDLQWDTYVTLGYQATSLTPGFPGFAEPGGAPVVENGNMAWFAGGGVTENGPQGAAWGEGADDPVVIMQLSAPEDLKINAVFQAQFVLDGVVTIKDFAFNAGGPPAPAPGALALLGLAGLAGARRRRA